jgi:hypothetical protein
MQEIKEVLGLVGSAISPLVSEKATSIQLIAIKHIPLTVGHTYISVAAINNADDNID